MQGKGSERKVKLSVVRGRGNSASSRESVSAVRNGRPVATEGREEGGRKVCREARCGRRIYARGLCQTHHRQLINTGKVGSIRPYRPRSLETVKFAGLRLTSNCADRLEAYAEDRGIARGAAIADILELWNEKRRRESRAK